MRLKEDDAKALVQQTQETIALGLRSKNACVRHLYVPITNLLSKGHALSDIRPALLEGGLEISASTLHTALVRFQKKKGQQKERILAERYPVLAEASKKMQVLELQRQVFAQSILRPAVDPQISYESQLEKEKERILSRLSDKHKEHDFYVTINPKHLTMYLEKQVNHSGVSFKFVQTEVAEWVDEHGLIDQACGEFEAGVGWILIDMESMVHDKGRICLTIYDHVGYADFFQRGIDKFAREMHAVLQADRQRILSKVKRQTTKKETKANSTRPLEQIDSDVAERKALKKLFS